MDTRIETWSVDVTANTAPLRSALSDMSRIGDQFASRLVNAFEAVALRGRKLEDVVKSLALSLSEMALKAAFNPIEDALGNAFGGILGGGAPAPAALPVPFARGGVIASPVTFPLGRTGAGLAGERGAEAILPLARGADGRLGVTASGAATRAVHVTFNIATPDVAGFRRSEAQIGAMLSRTLGAGERNQ